MTWGKARKKPVEVEYREVNPVDFDPDNRNMPMERIHTREGVLWAYPDLDYIIRGVEGEIYPIKKRIFDKTYDVTVDCAELRSKE